MQFPGPPPPLSPDEFLDWMRTDFPGLYVLGSLNRHITVHSQQCRAINLMHALMGDGRGLDDKAVAVVGAGFAGLTAAAFAVEKTTARVTVFDASPRPLWIQDSCANRWLHPGIYDWPYAGSLEPCTALPVLNWRAGSARNVVRQVRAQWDRIVSSKALLNVRMEKQVKQVDLSGKSLVLSVGHEQLPFDIVVVAAGFGLEGGGGCRVAYWNDSDGLDDIAPGASVLVSGFGDGGLADVLRLCLPDIRQASLVELVRHVPETICQKLIEVDNLYRFNGDALDSFYENLRVDSVIERLQDATAQSSRITLSGKDHLYGTGSAILNRFLVSQLWQARGEGAFELRPPVIPDSINELHDGRVQVTFENESDALAFDHVVLRWGPQPAYSRIEPLSEWRIGREHRKHWLELPQSLDRTRVLLDGVGNSQGQAQSQDQEIDFLAYESSSRRWCLILKPPDSTTDWRTLANQALEASGASFGLNVEPLERISTDALKDQASIRIVVRALCSADVLIADVTGYDPGVMFLLGIRAAVRRSITVACTSANLTPTEWQDVPFNLRELNLVSFADKTTGWKALSETIRAGLAQSGSSNGYLDLPVYDYVRDPPPAEQGLEPQPILFLRPFGKYDDARLIFVKNRVQDKFGGPGKVTIESVIDQKSPRLAGQRLYEAIRHWVYCVVDLTLWKPNVLFELGVRLATHPKGAYCLLDPNALGHEASMAARKLVEFLQPFKYNLLSSKAAFAKMSGVCDIIYNTVIQHFRTQQDHYNETAEVLLLTAASLVTGQDDPLQAVDIRPL